MSVVCLCEIVIFESQKRQAATVVTSVLVVEVVVNGPSSQVCADAKAVIDTAVVVAPLEKELAAPKTF